MPINIPSSILVGGRFPDSAKYWVEDYSNLNDGEIYVGLHRWVKSGASKDKEYVLLSNGVWKEVSNGEKGQAGTIKVGKVTNGTVAKVTNVGTDNAAIFDFILPEGAKADTPSIDIGQVRVVGVNESPSIRNVGTKDRAIFDFNLPRTPAGNNGVDGQSIWMAFADDANGTNPTFSAANKKFISFKQSTVQPLITQFTIWSQIQSKDGIDGKSVWTAFAQDQNGLGATFTAAPSTKFVAFYQSIVKPTLGAFTGWQRFVGNDGKDGGPAGLSAYQTYVNNGHPNATEEDFLNSLKGGNGLSAYQIWLSLGNVGSETSFINSLKAANYQLPTASSLLKGGVKVGERLTIVDDVLSADSQVANTLEDSTTKAPSVKLFNDTIANLELTGGGTAAPGSNLEKISYVIPSDGESSILVSEVVTNIVFIHVKEIEGGIRPVMTYTFSENILTFDSNCDLLTGDVVYIYYNSVLSNRPTDPPTDGGGGNYFTESDNYFNN